MQHEESLQQIERQWAIEEQYNRKLIDKRIREVFQHSPEIQAKITEGVGLVQAYMNQTYYESKNKRIAQLARMDLTELVHDLFLGISYITKAELFTAVSAQLAGRLGFSDKVQAIQTVAELLAVLCQTDVFDIEKASKYSSLMLISRIQLPTDILGFIENSHFLPPMLVKPLELVHNRSNGHLSYNDSLILSKGNHHEGDICLDVLNKINAVPLKLATDFLCQVEEDPNTEYTVEWAHKKANKKGQNITDAEAQQRVDKAIENFHRFKVQSYKFYTLMAQYGNLFYLTHKVDKRGRIYASGYHLSTQGTAFKKASIELHKEEVVTGVPL